MPAEWDEADGKRNVCGEACIRCWYGGEPENPKALIVRVWNNAMIGPLIFVHAMTLLIAGCIAITAGIIHLRKLGDLDWIDAPEPRPCQAIELVAKTGEPLNDRLLVETSCTYMLSQASTWGAGKDFASANGSQLDKPPQLVVWREKMWYSVGPGPESVADVEDLVGFNSGSIFSSDSTCYYYPNLVRSGKLANNNTLSVAEAVPADHPTFSKLLVSLSKVKAFSSALFYVFIASWIVSLSIHVGGLFVGAWTCQGDAGEENEHKTTKCSLVVFSILAWVSLGLLLAAAWSGVDDVSLDKYVEVAWGASDHLWSARWDAEQPGGYAVSG